MRRSVFLPLIALIASGLACGTGVGQFCRWVNQSGTCEVSYDRLSGAQTRAVAVDLPGQGLPVEVTLAVESGSARVSFPALDGSTIGAEASAGNPVSFTGVVAVSPAGEVSITVEAVGGEAKGVQVRMQFTRPRVIGTPAPGQEF